MFGRLYVSMLSDDRRCVGPDDGVSARHSYAVAVSERYRDEIRRGLRQSFPDLVNTVVSNVFIVDTDMTVAEFRATLVVVAAKRQIPVEVVFVEEMNWGEISRTLELSSAVA